MTGRQFLDGRWLPWTEEGARRSPVALRIHSAYWIAAAHEGTGP